MLLKVGNCDPQSSREVDSQFTISDEKSKQNVFLISLLGEQRDDFSGLDRDQSSELCDGFQILISIHPANDR